MVATTAYLFGRKTYEHMAAHWPRESDENPMARHLNTTPKYVVTRTLTRLSWNGSEILSGDVVESVGRPKSGGDGVIAVLGSGELSQTLIAAGRSITTGSTSTRWCSARASGSSVSYRGRGRCGGRTAPPRAPVSWCSLTSGRTRRPADT